MPSQTPWCQAFLVHRIPPDLNPALAARRVQADLFLGLARIQAVIEHRAAALLRELGLTDITPAQANVLMCVFQAREPVTARTLHRELGLAEPTVSRFVRALLKAGWVQRAQDPADRRAHLISPTQKAREALPRFIQVANTLLDEAFGDLPDEAVPALASHVATMTARLTTG